jgi:hypothetical protein
MMNIDWDRVVGLVTRPWAKCRRNRGFLPGRTNKYVDSKLPHRLWGPVDLLLYVQRKLFPLR